MIRRFHSSVLFALLALCAAAAGAQLPDAELPIQLDADSSDFDRRNSRLVFRNIRVSQGGFTITADQADSADLEFRDSRWIFTGNVRIDAPEARISAEKTTLNFSDGKLVSANISGAPASFAQTGLRPTQVTANQADLQFSGRTLSTATLEGEPAVFETTGANPIPTRGEAGRIAYKLKEGMLTLSGKAWLREGDNQISGDSITYNMIEQRVLANSAEDGGRVHITIIPPPVKPQPDGNPNGGDPGDIDPGSNP